MLVTLFLIPLATWQASESRGMKTEINRVGSTMNEIGREREEKEGGRRKAY